MKRETIDMSTIPNIRELIWEESIYDETTDELLYETVQQEITYVDLEKCYKTLYIVFQRVSDKRFFAFTYDYSYNWEDESKIIAEEVFPREETITIYE